VARAEIYSGNCGFTTVVGTTNNRGKVGIAIESECTAIRRMAKVFNEVEPFQEITFRGEGPLTLQMGRKYCSHTACPVPSGIIKAVEIEAGLAFPEEVTIKLSKSD
jgi:hypothetical protein